MAQSVSLKNVAQPGPEGSKFANYFSTLVNESTGNAQIEIPIYNLVVDGVTVPITLSYHTSGVKVTDLSGSVGLGWSLNAGGGIYRSINGLPDEKKDGSPSTFLNDNGFSPGSYLSLLNNVNSYYAQTILKSFANNNYDINQDDYSYNFLNRSGQLFFNVSQQLKEAVNSNTLFSYDSKYLLTINAVDSQGNQYTFSDKEKTSTYHITTPTSPQPDVTVHGTTSWKLSDITTIHNKQINFSYTDYTTQIVYPSGNSLSEIKGVSGSYTETCYSDRFTSSSTSTNVSSFNKLIDNIVTDEVSIQFYYIEVSSASNWKKKLDKIEIVSLNSGEKIRTIQFEHSLFAGDARLKLDAVKIKDRALVEIEKYEFTYNALPLPPVSTLDKDIFGYYNGNKGNTTLLKAFNLAGIGSSLFNSDRTVDAYGILAGSLETVKYPTGGTTKFYCGPNVVDGVRYAPGLRINKIETIDSDSKIVNTKVFSYQELTGRSTTFPDYAVRQQMVDPLFFNSNGAWSCSSENTYVLSNLPQNFYYGLITTKEMGGDGRDLVTKQYFIDPSADGATSGNILTGGYYRQRLYKKELYKENDLAQNIVKRNTFTFNVERNSNNDHLIWKLIPSYLTNTYLDNTLYTCLDYSAGVDSLYSLRSNWVTISQEEEKFFENGVETLSSNKAYEYLNKSHYLPTKETSYQSTGIQQVKKYSYPLDFNLAGNSLTDDITNGIRNLQQKHVIEPVIEQYSQLSDGNGNMVTTSALLTSFKPSTSLPNKLYYLNIDHPSTDFAPLSITTNSVQMDSRYVNRISFNNYDTNGNLLEQQLVGGIKVSYLYSYNKQFLIAEIKNSDFATVENVLGGATSVEIFSNSNPTDAQITVLVNQLRASPLLKDSYISSYTYEPLVGMTSKTDIKGMKTYFEYDDFQRLKNIKNQNGDILKSYCYNYAGQVTDCNGYTGVEVQPELLEIVVGYSPVRSEICLLGQEGQPPIAVLLLYGTAQLGTAVMIGQPVPTYFLDPAGTTYAPDGYYQGDLPDPVHGYRLYYLRDGVVLFSVWCDELDPAH
ncbi:hypothetical protein FA048_19535 [Pedobacter polaris]|uniref:YD repeat-containing protein n=1 Tax=Pedobacter polaris TaxID=2571273 RepID=A0A4U1CDX6_9SPHI|nr:hypothetical protein [Pedobacter polaris]TKC04534.1 hypothetical protein FA048_19535 [Pedobacter polaris]